MIVINFLLYITIHKTIILKWNPKIIPSFHGINGQPTAPHSTKKKHDLTILIFTRLIQFNSVQLIQSYNTEMAFNSIQFNTFQSNFHPINSVQLIHSNSTFFSLIFTPLIFNIFSVQFSPQFNQFSPIFTE